MTTIREAKVGKAVVGQERDYKLKAKAKLDAGAPLEHVTSEVGYDDVAVAAYQATNVLSPFEKAKLTPILRGQDGDRFIQAAASFALGDVEGGLKRMQVILKPHGHAKWTVVTYLPFLWQPERHIFLKPVMMTTFAQRVGHRFADVYSPELDPGVYETLLDLAREVREKVSDLGAQDMIDVQSSCIPRSTTLKTISRTTNVRQRPLTSQMVSALPPPPGDI